MTDPLRQAAETMRAVRDRCVWSAQITHRDLVPYLQEEAAEVVDAVEAGSPDDLREELGDLLWQVLFHAEIAARSTGERFDIDDVACGLTEKMVRRHPHVFADETAETPEQVLVLWNAAKAAEKRERSSVLDGISSHMPALAHAQKVLGRAASVLPPAPADPEPARLQPRAETAVAGGGLGAPMESRGRVTTEAELGDALLGLVTRARAEGWDAERALRERVRQVEAEVRRAESDARGGGLREPGVRVGDEPGARVGDEPGVRVGDEPGARAGDEPGARAGGVGDDENGRGDLKG